MRPKAASRALIVFGKNPVAGEVKTRLAASIGEEAAAELYRAFLLDSLASFSSVDADVRLYLAPTTGKIDGAVVDTFPDFLLQRGDGLGERMANAIRESFDAGYEQIGIVGSDIPTLPPETLSSGFSLATEGGLVIGPSTDGGYYFLMSQEFFPELFEGLAFGGDGVLRATVERAKVLGLRISFLEERYDVDTMADLRRLIHEIEHEPTRCPETWRTLKRLGIM